MRCACRAKDSGGLRLVQSERVFDATKAISFVEQHGDPVELARLRYVLSGERPAEAAVAAALAGQRDDGGWAPSWANDYSALETTCHRLSLAEQLGVEPSAAWGAGRRVIRALTFLTGRQRVDGSWEEDAAAATPDAPPWVKPGDPAARLYLTANCGYWLAVRGGPARSSAAMAAADALEQEMMEDGRLPSYAHAHWLAAGLFHRLDHALAAGRVLDRLRLYFLPDLAAGGLAWLLTSIGAAGVPARHPTVRAAAIRLGQSQRSDGRWVSEDDQERDVHTTLEALRALRWFGRARARSEQFG